MTKINYKNTEEFQHDLIRLLKKFPSLNKDIEVSKVFEIPMDYDGVMGVPITFLDKYNPEQFEIIGSNRGVDQDPEGVYGRGTYLDGKETFKRLLIKNKKLKN